MFIFFNTGHYVFRWVLISIMCVLLGVTTMPILHIAVSNLYARRRLEPADPHHAPAHPHQLPLLCRHRAWWTLFVPPPQNERYDGDLPEGPELLPDADFSR